MRALAAAVALLAWGCDGEPATPAHSCEVRGCPEGSSCVGAVCLADEPGDYEVAVRFTPKAASAQAQWTQPRLLSEVGDELPFRFKDRVTVRGSVTDDLGRSLPAWVELRRDSPLPGRAPIVAARSVRVAASFEITVPRGPALLTAWAVDSRRPPSLRSVSSCRTAPSTRASPSRRPRPSWCAGPSSARAGPQEPNVRVWAVDPDTGVPVTASVLTADQSTGADAGTFRLLVPTTVERIAIRATESDLNWARALPTIQFPEVVVASLPFHAEEPAYEVPSANLTLPPTTRVTLSGTVEGRPRAGGRVAIGGAILRFSSDDLGAPGVPDIPGTMERIVRSARDGTYEVELPGGTYRVEVTPPAESAVADLAVGVVSQFVNAAPEDPRQSGIVLEAPPRLAFGGRVVDAEGGPIGAALLWLHGGGELADPLLGHAENGVRSVSATTSPDGAFLALVDGGHFDAVVEPPADAGLPWASGSAWP